MISMTESAKQKWLEEKYPDIFGPDSSKHWTPNSPEGAALAEAMVKNLNRNAVKDQEQLAVPQTLDETDQT